MIIKNIIKHVWLKNMYVLTLKISIDMITVSGEYYSNID